MAKVQIKGKNAESYIVYDVNEDANNITNINIDNTDYVESTALKTLQKIANTTISSNGAYWKDITYKIISDADLFGNEYNVFADCLDVKICCNKSFIFICVVLEYAYKSYIVYYYSVDSGNSWHGYKIENETSFSSPSIHDIACYNTYLGYRIEIALEKTSSAQNVYTVIISHNNDIYNYVKDNLNNIDGVVCIPYGFLIMTLQDLSSYSLTNFYMYPYTYTNNQASNFTDWDANFSSFSSDYRDIYTDACYDKILNKLIIRAKDGKRLFLVNTNDMSTDSTINVVDVSSSESITKLFTAFNRVFCVISDSSASKLAYISNDVSHTVNIIDLPVVNSGWDFAFGNNYRLYIVNQDGEIIYLNSINGEWNVVDQSIQMNSDSTYKTLNFYKYFSVQNSEFISDEEATYMIGKVYDNDDDVYKIIMTSTKVLQ